MRYTDKHKDNTHEVMYELYIDGDLAVHTVYPKNEDPGPETAMAKLLWHTVGNSGDGNDTVANLYSGIDVDYELYRTEMIRVSTKYHFMPTWKDVESYYGIEEEEEENT